MAYPFSPAKPGGYVPGDVPTHTELNKIDEQAAAGADGAQWTDVAQLVNLPYAFTNTNGGSVVVYHPILDAFLTFNVSAGNPVGRLVRAPFESLTNLTLAAGVGLTPQMVMIDPVTGVTVVTGAPGGSSQSVIRRSATGLASYTAQNRAGGATVAGPISGTFCGGAFNKFFIGFGSGSPNGVIESSADGLTWSNVAGLPDTNVRSSMAFSAILNRLVVVSRDSANYLTSDNGTTFTSRAAPAAMSTIFWSTFRQRFYGIAPNEGDGSVAFYSSPNGEPPWTNLGTVVTPAAPFGFNPLPGNGRPILEFGRVMLVGVNLDKIYVSTDGLASMKNVLDLAHTAGSLAISANGQIVIGTSAGVHRAGFRYGF